MTGTLYAGTSGFAYPAWAPRFYPPGLRPEQLLAHYAGQLSACELNNTFYQQPTEAKIRSWRAATPSDFRFAVKAQKGGSMRALLSDPDGSVPWLTAPYRFFGDRLGTVLYRVPANVQRDDGRLDALLARWPATLPLTMEFQDSSWHVDETFDLLRRAGAALCATELPDTDDSPSLIVTGRFLYVRLRRHEYSEADVADWAARLVPFLDGGLDVFVFFRHDKTGANPGLARSLAAGVRERQGASARA
jgi:uncharacterized protein YecE (DUF72 family)